MHAGRYKNLDEAGHAMVHMATTVIPDQQTKSAYDDAFGRYLATYPCG